MQLIRNLKEKYGVSYDYHSVQININKMLSEKDYFFYDLQARIQEKNLYIDPEDNSLGRENQPHVTVLYGLTDDRDCFRIGKFLKKIPYFYITLGKISLFTNDPNYDVVKVEIISPELVLISNKIRDNCDNENKYPDYQPHMTLAYVKKGALINTENNIYEGKKILVKEFEFSHKENIYVSLELKKE